METKDDYTQVEELTREAFWNLYFPGCNDHYLCHILREHKDFIKELTYVVELEGKIVASIMYTHSYLINNNEEIIQTVSFGPLCVHPNYQRKGIGTALVEKTKLLAIKMGVPAITIYGDPRNYCKHGFKNGIDYQVSNMDGEYPLGLLVLELQPGFFGDKNWKVQQSDIFNFDQGEVNEFDKKFQEKEKKYQHTQELFKMLIRSYLRNNN
ncbi:MULTISPECIES: GNAT family N-acetyltransferase [unclassified Vibrio]|uniref:GNAT family N-acetyltransferase n=1 Tax=unclassified Vibrio TaxID=2614977 RepID=UPI001C3CF3FB|nr:MULTISPECIES: N-acetyltransferase [unclassified Vibrio]